MRPVYVTTSPESSQQINFQTNDSFDPIFFRESKTFSSINLWATPERMTLMNRFF